MERFRHSKQYWIGLHSSGLLHPLSTRSLLVSLELYEHRKMCTEWHMHFSVVLSVLLFTIQSNPRTVRPILHEDLKFHPFKIQLVQQLLIPVIWINGVNVAGNSCKWSRERHKRSKMCLASNGAHLSDIIFKKVTWKRNAFPCCLPLFSWLRFNFQLKCSYSSY